MEMPKLYFQTLKTRYKNVTLHFITKPHPHVMFILQMCTT